MSVLQKAAQVIETLGKVDGPVRLGALAEELSLPKSSAHRLLNELCELGLVTRCADGQYAIGTRLLRWGQMANRNVGLRTVALPIMTRLRDQLQESVMLSVREGTNRVSIASVDSGHLLRPVLPLGTRTPLGRGASGTVLLAYSEPTLLEEVRLQLDERERRALATPRHLSIVRQRGWAASDSTTEDGLAAVAAAVLDDRDGILAAVTVAGARVRMPKERQQDFVEPTLRAAHEIAAAVRGLTAPDQEFS
jgi:DNA-binding IclR family transcriptional regulator